MVYRGASTLRWFELPGIVAAYQPVRAPDPIAARQNVGAGLLGRYTATPGVAPQWTAPKGWTFDISNTMYLTTGLVPVMDTTWSMFCRFSYFSLGVSYPTVIGCRNTASGGVEDFIISADEGGDGAADYNRLRNGKGNTGLQVGPPRREGVVGFSGLTGYVDGIAIGTLLSSACSNTRSIYIGCMNNQGSLNYFLTGTIKNAVVLSRTLSAAEVWQLAQQLKYCDTVPEFNVWARQRQWSIAPAAVVAATGQPASKRLGGIAGAAVNRGVW